MSRAAASAPLALALALALAGPARGEMYRCKDAAGREIFTSDAAACPGAQRHQPSRDVQRLGGDARVADAAAAPAAPPGARTPAPEPQSEDAQAAMWKRKRVDAETERRELTRLVGEIEEVVTWCNRGGGLIVEDDLGVRKDYDCEDAQQTYTKASARLTELRRYLAGGLEDECRRAGCLPGWIR